MLAGCCGWVVVIFLERNGLAVVLVLGWDVGVWGADEVGGRAWEVVAVARKRGVVRDESKG